jgi:hypothetical protein
MCSIKINPKILVHSEKNMMHCLWNKKTGDGEKCNPLAVWDMVCRPKDKGGVGILNLKVQNDAFLLNIFTSSIIRCTLLYGIPIIRTKYLKPWIHVDHIGGRISRN